MTTPRIGVRVMLTTSRVSWRVSCTLGRVSSITNTRDLLRNKLGPRAGGLVVAKNGHSIIAFQRCPALEKIRARYCHCHTALVGLCHVCAFPFPGRDCRSVSQLVPAQWSYSFFSYGTYKDGMSPSSPSFGGLYVLNRVFPAMDAPHTLRRCRDLPNPYRPACRSSPRQ